MYRPVLFVGIGLATLSGCVAPLKDRGPVDVKIIAFNDFHGNLEPPRLAVDAAAGDGALVRVPAGGVANLASVVARLRAANPNHAVVSAGDLIGASPLASALFLDEPTIAAMNLIGVDFNAVGNHEFDRGRAELMRMQRGGCDKHTALEPCQVEPFAGATFGFLAANVLDESGRPLFAPSAIRSYARGRVRVGFIGMTLKETPSAVTPAGVAGLRFVDEAETANALVPALRADRADAIVVIIHQGASTDAGAGISSCQGLTGALLPILDRLDPAVDVVVSGHTHRAYVCDYARPGSTKPLLVTSAGQYGTIVTDITLSIDRGTRRVTASAANVPVPSGTFTSALGPVATSPAYPVAADAKVAALVERYVRATAPLTARVVGRLSAPAIRALTPAREQVLGDLIADAQLAATRAPQAGAAQLALMNPGGVRADIVPAADGSVTYGQIFAAQPFGNTLVVKTLTGAQLRAVLEQQFASGTNTVASPRILLPSSNLRYAYDRSRPAGSRIVDLRLDGQPVAELARYRVAMNSFLASGGDDFSVFAGGTDAVGGIQDVDALERYLASGTPITPPVPDRIRDLTPEAGAAAR